MILHWRWWLRNQGGVSHRLNFVVFFERCLLSHRWFYRSATRPNYLDFFSALHPRRILSSRVDISLRFDLDKVWRYLLQTMVMNITNLVRWSLIIVLIFQLTFKIGGTSILFFSSHRFSAPDRIILTTFIFLFWNCLLVMPSRSMRIAHFIRNSVVLRA